MVLYMFDQRRRGNRNNRSNILCADETKIEATVVFVSDVVNLT